MTYEEITKEIKELDEIGERMCIQARALRRHLSAVNLKIGVLYQRKWALEAQLIPEAKYKYYAPKPKKKEKEVDWETAFARLSDEQKEKLIQDIMEGLK